MTYFKKRGKTGYVILVIVLVGLFHFRKLSGETWSQSNQEEFAVNTMENVDISTSQGEVRISGAYPPDKNTVLLLHFDETEGETAKDSSGMSFSGILRNMKTPSCWVEGKFGNALRFYGNKDYVSLGNNPKFSGMNELTIEAWIYVRDFPYASSCIIVKHQSYALSIDKTGKIIFSLCDQDGKTQRLASAVPIFPERWYHIAGTWSSTEGKMKLWINGIQESETQDITLSVVKESGSDLTISSGIVGLHGFNGIIDEVRISNIARNSFPGEDGYFTSGIMTSPRINPEGREVRQVALEWEDDVPAGVSPIRYYVTNDGGNTWHPSPGNGATFIFPSPGRDLRVKAVLRRGKHTPVLKRWKATY